ncbi:winged helix DNA-binding protein [Testudinibacter sp. TR-2022]|uniref:MarR family winged helix-turn-helix transcriptional regulator n=1 Tax=Testudinibacter sp. TR-2022 TaxID=2585029 RepID=UPI00111A24A0|nr:MarR family transcriptional regulator [Testudinibacter sp. TR-2022]TNH02465.1 winged helix DNA-binding protein [Pasteurellaceae bacterium Phil31]TNH09879.1 winged helix DNA-binding protein [Testudinibacter sp. TR-2022]TNH10561.1 winged helix DNA-binding protein [Testudinibacter sp. TR-2022]TNH13632.1 winged helix DNA-binding protein [Testudinibacter sp. TR-2022]TNH18160.1 winged helix DNA-binding protein [Testudinibacter sp. TR-2022]
MQQIQHNINALFNHFNEIIGLYRQLAKRLGVGYNTLAVLYCIYFHGQCTQKMIGESWWLPKQTVNNLTQEMLGKGWLEQVDDASPRRGKLLRFTAEGLAFAEPIVQAVMQAERATFTALGDEHCEMMLGVTARYAELFKHYSNLNTDAE